MFSIAPFHYVTSLLLLSFQTLFYPLLSSLSFTFFSVSFFFIPNVPLPFHIFPYSSRSFSAPVVRSHLFSLINPYPSRPIVRPNLPFLSHQSLSFPSLVRPNLPFLSHQSLSFPSLIRPNLPFLSHQSLSFPSLVRPVISIIPFPFRIYSPFQSFLFLSLSFHILLVPSPSLYPFFPLPIIPYPSRSKSVPSLIFLSHTLP